MIRGRRKLPSTISEGQYQELTIGGMSRGPKRSKRENLDKLGGDVTWGMESGEGELVSDECGGQQTAVITDRIMKMKRGGIREIENTIIRRAETWLGPQSSPPQNHYKSSV